METETKETPCIKGALIYQPQGAAGEYAKWAINLYHGCSNGCTYCYNRRGVLSHAFGDKPELAAPIVKARDKLLNEYLKKNNMTAHDTIEEGVVEHKSLVAACDIISKDLEKIGIDRIRQDGGIFFSFTCDPFDTEENIFILQQVVLHLIFDCIPVTILTKNVNWMQTGLWNSTLRDLSADYKDRVRYLTIGFSVTGNDKLEPGAPSTKERIEALRKLHDEYKIKTFVSLEPITDLDIALEVIKETSKITNEIRLGVQSPIKKDRYDPNEFTGFVVLVKIMARSFDCRFMVKESMYKQAETFEGDDRDVCIAKLDEIRKIYESKQTENDEK